MRKFVELEILLLSCLFHASRDVWHVGPLSLNMHVLGCSTFVIASNRALFHLNTTTIPVELCNVGPEFLVIATDDLDTILVVHHKERRKCTNFFVPVDSSTGRF
jgi:hypothetical protein